MDRLGEMFELQKKLQMRLGTWMKIGTDVENMEKNKQQFTNQMVLAMMEEVVEIMRETAYKNPDYVPFGWKKTQLLQRDKVLGEVVDLWHFMMNICINYNFTADDFYKEYCKKNNVNHERQDNGY